MLGGHTIETDAEARTFTAAMRAHPAVWSPRDLDTAPLAIGETVELEPCVGPYYEADHGRPCPREELWPENGAAADLIFAALHEHTRALLPAYVEALTLELPPEEARTVVLRAFRELQGPTVTGWLRAQLQPKEAKA